MEKKKIKTNHTKVLVRIWCSHHNIFDLELCIGHMPLNKHLTSGNTTEYPYQCMVYCILNERGNIRYNHAFSKLTTKLDMYRKALYFHIFHIFFIFNIFVNKFAINGSYWQLCIHIHVYSYTIFCITFEFAFELSQNQVKICILQK